MSSRVDNAEQKTHRPIMEDALEEISTVLDRLESKEVMRLKVQLLIEVGSISLLFDFASCACIGYHCVSVLQDDRLIRVCQCNLFRNSTESCRQLKSGLSDDDKASCSPPPISTKVSSNVSFGKSLMIASVPSIFPA